MTILIQMWTGDSKLSIRESLRNALDVHTPPPNSVARIRRASAIVPPQGAAASVVAAAQRRAPQTAGVSKRKSVLPGAAARRVSTAPTSSSAGISREKSNSSYVRNNNTGVRTSVHSGMRSSNRESGGNSEVLPALRNRLGRSSSKGGD